MSHPICLLNIGGVPASAGVMSRLISCTVTDKEGFSADTIDIELLGGPYVGVPRGTIITCSMGYEDGGVAFMGSFKVDEGEIHCLPYTVKIQGKSADMREKLKEHRERHFENKSVKDIVSQIAGEHGLSAQVDAAVGAHKYPWFGQQNESSLHVLRRLADRHGALLAIKNGKLIFGKKGAGLSAAGALVSSIVVTPQMIVEGTCSVKFAERPAHNEASGAWHDQGEAERKHEDAPAGSGSAHYSLRHAYADQDEAKAAAASKGKDLQRSGDTTSVTIIGNPAARGGGNMSYAGVHVQADGRPWVIETATHSFSKQGYTTQIEAKARV
ncbi:MAG: phage late control D family protein [Hyphomicrobium sp.]